MCFNPGGIKGLRTKHIYMVLGQFLFADSPTGEAPERSSEVRIKGINERVNGAVHPANPCEERHEALELFQLRPEGHKDVESKKRCPACD